MAWNSDEAQSMLFETDGKTLEVIKLKTKYILPY